MDGISFADAARFISPSPLGPSFNKDRREVISLDSKVTGMRMKQKRLEKKMAQADMTTESGISSKYYGSIEDGRSSPSVEKLSTVVKALGCSLHYLLNDHMEDTENRAVVETKRLQEISNEIPCDKFSLVEGLIVQAAQLRVLLDDNWKSIIENGEYEKFRQSENQIVYDRKGPIVENYDIRDRTYQAIIKQFTGLLPQNAKLDKESKSLGRK